MITIRIASTIVRRLVEQLLYASSFAQLSEEATVSTLHAFPLHFLQPILEHILFFHLTLERSFDDVGLDAFTSVFRFSTLLNKLFGES
jgi:hypothetical protein